MLETFDFIFLLRNFWLLLRLSRKIFSERLDVSGFRWDLFFHENNLLCEGESVYLLWSYSEWAFSGLLTDRRDQKDSPSLPKICCTYHTIMKLDTLIPYLKRIQKIYKSRDASVEFPDISIFYRKSATFVVSKNTDIDSILTRSFWFF